MPKFLIEVPHDADPEECKRAIRIFLRTGSYFLSHADWGCMDGNHKAWIIIDVDNKDEARGILPPAFRSRASIVGLNKFKMGENEAVLAHQQQA